MKKRLHLHIPTLPEMAYRQKLQEDPATMSYNAGYELGFEGYHNDTGCIDFPESKWAEDYAWLVGNEPRQFYAYVVRDEDGEFIGEVNVHCSREGDWYDMGIVIEAKYRGMGYSGEALRLLLDYAFTKLGVPEIHNDFEDTRSAAYKTHLACGFREFGRKGGIILLRITREEYLAHKKDAIS
ncbi:MAG: GNAT family N-acetyltransferase [Ruminococcaceae bacterium]|nr:GNAT family N-acetyltransferase [Oscillospiraceae bacterium]